jgi:hypothetical protein
MAVNIWSKIGFMLAISWLASATHSASAQSPANPYGGYSSPTVGGTMGGQNPGAPTPNFGASAGSDMLRHRDFAGKPCLDVTGFARPHTIDAHLYDHVISAHNNCPQRIDLKVCYYQSEDCIPMGIPGGEKREAILGTLPATKDFRFEFREKF